MHIISISQDVVVSLVVHALRVQEWAITPIILQVEVSLIAVYGIVTAATLRAEAPASPAPLDITAQQGPHLRHSVQQGATVQPHQVK